VAALPLPSRHDLVHLRPSWPGALVSAPDPALVPHVEAWLGRGLPAVACRVAAGLPAGAVALGIALRVGSVRRRVSFAVAPEAMARVGPPLPLGSVIESAPPGWRGALGELDARARGLGLSFRVYGSLSWQHLSGESHVRGASDVDLLVRPRTGAELERALRLLEHAPSSAPRLDGEVLLEEGRAVAWRELLAAPPRVLVKDRLAVALLPLREALGPLATGAAA